MFDQHWLTDLLIGKQGEQIINHHHHKWPIVDYSIGDQFDLAYSLVIKKIEIITITTKTATNGNR